MSLDEEENKEWTLRVYGPNSLHVDSVSSCLQTHSSWLLHLSFNYTFPVMIESGPLIVKQNKVTFDQLFFLSNEKSVC